MKKPVSNMESCDMRVLLLSLLFSYIAFALPPTPDERVYDDPYWGKYFSDVDEAVAENFFGALDIYRKSEMFKDPYITQLKAMGYSFAEGDEHPAAFLHSIRWICAQLEALVASGQVAETDVLWPGKAFSLNGTYVFVALGAQVPPGAKPLNLLTPDAFVAMLAAGFFPVSEPIREHTNQTLAEHDLAHLAGFVSNPRFMRSVREAFRRVGVKMQTNPRVAKALKEFDSLYSLRLYYMVEVFTEVPKGSHAELEKLLGLRIDQHHTREEIVNHLLKMAQRPADVMKYLALFYARAHALINPLGGESRDLLNRRRKQDRDAALGGFYDGVSTLTSKFYGNSLYSLLLNARHALENKRSNHPDFYRSLEEIHAPLIGAILGTSRLSVEDWVLECVEEVPRPDSALYQYIHGCGFFGKGHALHWAYCEPEYDKVLNAKDMEPPVEMTE